MYLTADSVWFYWSLSLLYLILLALNYERSIQNFILSARELLKLSTGALFLVQQNYYVIQSMRAILCDKCDKWSHIKCNGISSHDYQLLDSPWFCYITQYIVLMKMFNSPLLWILLLYIKILLQTHVFESQLIKPCLQLIYHTFHNYLIKETCWDNNYIMPNYPIDFWIKRNNWLIDLFMEQLSWFDLS